MTQILWFLTRASGVVAMVLIVLAVADGLIFSGREGGRRLRPAWWMDMHRGLGGYALLFTGLHLLTAYGAGLGLSIATVFIPNASSISTTAYTLGVLALYAMTIIVLSSWPKRRLPRRFWHLVHLLSIPAAVAAAVHGWQLGTDATSPWYMVMMVGLAGLATYPLVLRLSGIARRRRDSTPTSRAAAPSKATGPQSASARALVDTTV